jgi:hypothetical protein
MALEQLLERTRLTTARALEELLVVVRHPE